MTGYLAPAGLQTFLAGKVPQREDVVEPQDLYDFDRRTGIGVDPDRLTAQESLIYSASFLTLKPGVHFYLEIDLPEDAPPGLWGGSQSLALGGEGRQVEIRPVETFSWPNVPAGTGQGVLLLLTTPGLFGAGWCPACLGDGTELVAASVPGHQAVSGWDLARGGPKATRFAVQAGSVYFVSGTLDKLPQNSLADCLEDRRQGWGCYLRGVWNDV